MSESKNCIDVVKPFVNRLDNEETAPVQIFGGIYSAALNDPRTVIDTVDKLVVAPADLELSTIRNDSAKSLRDIDVLVQSADPSEISKVLSIMQETIGDELELSAFGYKTSETLRAQLRNPLGVAALTACVSDRFIDPRSENLVSGDMVKSVFPFWTKIDQDSLETWRLQIDKQYFPVPNPVSSLINYTNRSISGIRPKDESKVAGMAETILAKAPELREWAIDGPGKSQVELGVLLRSLTPTKQHPDPLGVGTRRILTAEELTEDSEFFMVPELDINRKMAVINLAMAKAGIIHFGESNPYICSFYQKYMERLAFFDKIVKSSHGSDTKDEESRLKSVA